MSNIVSAVRAFAIAALVSFASIEAASANAACMQEMAAAGQRLGFTTDINTTEVSVVTGAAGPLRPLWSRMETCLKGAFAKRRDGKASGRGPYSYRQWYTEAGGGFEWCTTTLPAPDRLSAQNPNYAVWVRCGSGAQMPNGMF